MEIFGYLMCIILVIALLYFFGIFDKIGDVASFVGTIIIFLGACVVVYFIFAGIHKVFGPFIFGA